MKQDTSIQRNHADGVGPTGAAHRFTHPDQVLHSRDLSVADKRRILAGWASDARAIANRPAMRQLESGAIVGVASIMAALRALDASQVSATPTRGHPINPGVRHPLDVRWLRGLSRRNDDDDDPPPCPATALPPGVELELRRTRDASWGLAAA